MKLYFLGTVSQKPSKTRNVTSIALILECMLFILFDCGEGTQHQILKSPLSLSNLHSIFITHLHGDHIFGLPGLLCSLNDIIVARDKPELIIYGPFGLRSFVESVLFNSVLHYKLIIIEFNSYMGSTHLDKPILIPGKSNNERSYLVQNFPVQHTCIAQGNTNGFVFKQIDQKIKFKNPQESGLFDILEKNKEFIINWIKEKTGDEVKDPRYVLRVLQNPKYTDCELILPEGISIKDDRFVEIPKRGICICLIIDSCNSNRAIEALNGLECDILVHESTNAKTSLDGEKSYAEIELDTLQHGHYTPQLAGKLAKTINPKQLILTHFSSRYKDDTTNNSLAIMEEIRQCAIETFEKPNVITARDFMEVDLHTSEELMREVTNTLMNTQIGKVYIKE